MNFRHIGFGLLVLLATNSKAAAQGFRLPNLNPFAVKKKTPPPGPTKNIIRRTGQPRVRPVSRSISDSPRAKKRNQSWVPDLRPQWMKPTPRRSRRAQYARRQPSTLENITNGTGRFLNSLNPFAKRRKAVRPRTLRPPTGARRTVPPRSSRRSKKSTSYLPNLFGQTRRPLPPPRTPIEFLKQPRVQP